MSEQEKERHAQDTDESTDEPDVEAHRDTFDRDTLDRDTLDRDSAEGRHRASAE
jgi:hypothetical protein